MQQHDHGPPPIAGALHVPAQAAGLDEAARLAVRPVAAVGVPVEPIGHGALPSPAQRPALPRATACTAWFSVAACACGKGR